MSARDGKDKAASPFRQESLDRAKSPEQLDDYIRVSNPGVWMVLGAVRFLLFDGCNYRSLLFTNPLFRGLSRAWKPPAPMAPDPTESLPIPWANRENAPN